MAYEWCGLNVNEFESHMNSIVWFWNPRKKTDGFHSLIPPYGQRELSEFQV